MKRLVLLFMLASLVLFSMNASALDISIVRPTGGNVGTMQVVQGRITPAQPNVKVWVIVHPMTGGLWAQRGPAETNSSGVWFVQAQFGEHGQHKGVGYQFWAVANPNPPLRVGAISSVPQAEARSQVVTVTKTMN